MKHKTPRGKPARSKRRSHRSIRTDKQERLFLFGIHTVGCALENAARVKYRLLATANAAQKLQKQINKLHGKLEIQEVTPRDLDGLVGRDAVHQGVVLECDILAPKALEQLMPGDPVLVLDQISDPHNVGAIMRSCVAMGVGTLITTSRNSAAQTAVLAKSASGALDLIDVIEVSNLSKAIETLNAQGYQTIGLDSEGPDILERSIDIDAPLALVLGAEGQGLRHKTRLCCSVLARLDMPGKIKSLNVSNAAALALYITRRGR